MYKYWKFKQKLLEQVKDSSIDALNLIACLLQCRVLKYVT